MKKELFKKTLDALEKQYKADEQASFYLSKVFTNAFQANLLPDNHYLTNILIEILQTEMNDFKNNDKGMSWIEYFMYELDFGKKYRKGMIRQNGNDIDLSDAGKLYDFLKNNLQIKK